MWSKAYCITCGGCRSHIAPGSFRHRKQIRIQLPFSCRFFTATEYILFYFLIHLLSNVKDICNISKTYCITGGGCRSHIAPDASRHRIQIRIQLPFPGSATEYIFFYLLTFWYICWAMWKTYCITGEDAQYCSRFSPAQNTNQNTVAFYVNFSCRFFTTTEYKFRWYLIQNTVAHN